MRRRLVVSVAAAVALVSGGLPMPLAVGGMAAQPVASVQEAPAGASRWQPGLWQPGLWQASAPPLKVTDVAKVIGATSTPAKSLTGAGVGVALIDAGILLVAGHEGKPVPSPALLQRRGQTFRRAVESFARANGIPMLSFTGRKDKAGRGY